MATHSRRLLEYQDETPHHWLLRADVDFCRAGLRSYTELKNNVLIHVLLNFIIEERVGHISFALRKTHIKNEKMVLTKNENGSS